MREIVLDTETTGLAPADGHRVVEIGAVELENLLPTGRVYHCYINPERPMPREARNIHGLGDDFLRDQPVFASIAPAFLEFIAGARLVIVNDGETPLDGIAQLRFEERIEQVIPPAIRMLKELQ